MPTPSPKSINASALESRRDWFAWALLGAVILCFALAIPLMTGKVQTRDDLGGFHLPVRAFYAQQLTRGQSFDWMPQLYSGFFLTGEGQIGAYHPLHLFLYRWLSLPVAVGLQWLLPYPLMLAGMWLFLNRLVRRRDAALFGAVVFTFSSFNLLHFIHPNAVAVIAHMPWLLWAIDIALVDSRRRRVAAAQLAVALLTGSQLLLGYPQYVWFSLVAEVAYAGYAISVRRPIALSRVTGSSPCAPNVGRVRCAWPGLLISVGCGVLIGCAQLIPTVDALSESTRQSADATFGQWGALPAVNMVQWVAPYLLTDRVVGENTHELSVYIGVASLMLLFWLLVRKDALGELATLAKAAGLFALVALFLSFGKNGQLYRLQGLLPVVGGFRCPCRYLLLFQLGISVLATIGFIVLVRDYSSNRLSAQHDPDGQNNITARCVLPLAIVVAAGAIAALFGLLYQGHPRIASTAHVLAGPLLLAAAAAGVLLAARGIRWAMIGLILLTALDLGAYGFSYAVYPRATSFSDFIGSIEGPPTAPSQRIIAAPLRQEKARLRTGNQLTLAGYHQADGYAGLEPEKQLCYAKLPALRVAGVRWVHEGPATAQIPQLEPGPGPWLEVPRPLERFRLVGRIRPSDNPSDDLARIDLETTALSEVPLALDPSDPGTVAVVRDEPGRMIVCCRCPADQMLVISESYHRGWRAMVDGTPVELWRINGDFLGCVVPPGEHRVTLEFRPTSIRRGRIVSCLGLGLAAICFILGQFPSHANRHFKVIP